MSVTLARSTPRVRVIPLVGGPCDGDTLEVAVEPACTLTVPAMYGPGPLTGRYLYEPHGTAAMWVQA